MSAEAATATTSACTDGRPPALGGLRAVVVDSMGPEAHYERELAVLEPLGVELAVEDCAGDSRALAKSAASADVVLVRDSKVDRAAIAEMAAAGRCQGIIRYGVGVDNIDLAAAAAAGIRVANVPDYGMEEVSDHALSLLLAVNRQVVRRDRAVRTGHWDAATVQTVHRLKGCTVGIVGYGRIARAFRRKIGGFEPARVLVFDPVLEDWPADVEPVDLKTLCAEADYISVHCPLCPPTRHMLNAEMLAIMKPGVVLVNTARGGVIDEPALADALRSGHVRGAGIDNFEAEPVPLDHPLLAPDLENVVAVHELQTKAAMEAARVLKGESLLNWVNRRGFQPAAAAVSGKTSGAGEEEE